MKPIVAILLLLLPFSGMVNAEEGVSDHKVSITICPFHLFNPELHLTGEFRLAPKMSVAAILGAGQITLEGNTSNIWEVGAQFRYYLFGSFAHGMMIGADAGYVDINDNIEDPLSYLAGTHAGGFLGYKYSMKIGFTVEIQLGPVYLWGKSADTSELQTLAYLKIGWSF